MSDESDEVKYAILSVSGKEDTAIGATACCFLEDNEANILEEYGRAFHPEYALESFYFEAKNVDMEKISCTADIALRGLNPVLCPTGKPPEDGFEPFIYVFEIVAVDRIGIAAKIMRNIADLGVNVRQVEGRRKKLGRSKKAVYTGSFRVQIPPDSVLPMRKLVERFIQEEHWDIDLRPEKSWYGTNNLVPLFSETMASVNSVDPPSSKRWGSY